MACEMKVDSPERDKNPLTVSPSHEEEANVTEISDSEPVSKDEQTYCHSFQGEKYLFTNQIPEELLCPVCFELMNEPHQTMCGHLFCKRCLIQIIEKPQIEVNEQVKCPVCRSEDKGVFPDRNTVRRIKNLTIKCPNTPCSWKGSLCHLEKHRSDAKGCLYEKVACPRGCNSEIVRKTLEKHQKEECPKRPETCEYCTWAGTHERMQDHHRECAKFPISCPNNCHPDFLIAREDMKKHLKMCPQHRVVCPNKCRKSIVRKYLRTHELNECPKRLVKCEHCATDFVYENMKIHCKTCVKYPLPCVNNCLTGTVPRDGMERHLQTCPKQKIKCSYSKIGCLEVIQRGKVEEHEEDAREHHLKLSLERVTQLTDLVLAFSTKLAVIENHLQLTDVCPAIAIPILSQCSKSQPWLENRNLVPMMPWVVKVDNFEERKRKNEMWASEPIFTEINGYQIGLQVYPNGSNDSFQQHVSVHCQVRQGPNDNFLSWPFVGTIKYSLLNQEENTNHKSSIAVFVPRAEQSKGVTESERRGLSKFITHGDLTKEGNTFLVKDCLYFRIELA